ncbi:MAG: hypothetical protein WDZ85_00845 [Candidatus Paceibacterota bacterium]
MDLKKILINSLIILLLLAALWLGYQYFFGEETESGLPGVTSSRPSSVSTGQESEFVLLLSRLRNVQLNADFLTDPIFSAELQDYTTTLPVRGQGRSNPFANFGTGNLTASSANQPATEGATPAPTDEEEEAGNEPTDSEPVDF